MDHFGSLKHVSLRSIWANEAQHFTPWLAENLDKLGSSLSIELELVEIESAVGSFSLDIKAVDLSSNRAVVIENQFNKTDHDHLGKLLTYAAGNDAGTIIWISENFREEHREAIDWLNHITDSETNFFGVIVEVIQIDDSRPAFNFKIVSSPNEWAKTTKRQLTKTSMSSKQMAYQEYFQKLADRVHEVFGFTKRRGSAQNWIEFSSGRSGIRYGANFTKEGYARAELYIDAGDAEENRRIFEKLLNEKESYESEMGQELDWDPLDEKRACRISVYRPGTITEDEDQLERLQEWHAERVNKFKTVFGNSIHI